MSMEHRDKLAGRGWKQQDRVQSRGSNEDPGHYSHGAVSANPYHQRPGTPHDVSAWNVSSPYSMNFPAFYGPTPVCTNCIILGNELNFARNTLREVSSMVTTKVLELGKCHDQIQDLKYEVEQLKKECQNLQQLKLKTASSFQIPNGLEDKNSFVGNTYCESEDNILIPVKEFTSELMEVTRKHVAEESFEGLLTISPSNSYMESLNCPWQESPSKQTSPSNSKDIHPKQQHPKRASEDQNPQVGPSQRETPSRNDRNFSSNRQQQRRAPEEASGSKGSNVESGLIKEIKCDLFKMPESHALAHCVGSDFIMSSGIAVQFRKKFRNIPELLDQNKKPGQVAFLKVQKSGQYIYYLVTKLCSTGKPMWEDFEKSVAEWKDLCLQHEIKKIAIPKIGCGRDLLDWKKVLNLLNQQFSNTGIEITVCLIDSESAPERKWSLILKHCPKPLSELDPVECALVFIASKDRFVTPTIQRLASKYGFESDYKSHALASGSLYHTVRRSANIFGLVVKDRHDEPVSFFAIGKCLQDLKRVVKKSKLYYMGFEAFDDPMFSLATRKVWTIIIDAFFIEDIEVHFCWPEEVKEKCWEERK